MTQDPKEARYADDVRFFLEDDGLIDAKERRILDRLRVKLGIDPQRAALLEREVMAAVNPYANLSEAEKAYLEEIKFCLEDDGIIDASERRMLERSRAQLGIAPERAGELEALIAERIGGTEAEALADEDPEQGFMDEARAIAADGEMSLAQKYRVIEAHRRDFGVSEQRADELMADLDLAGDAGRSGIVDEEETGLSAVDETETDAEEYEEEGAEDEEELEDIEVLVVRICAQYETEDNDLYVGADIPDLSLENLAERCRVPRGTIAFALIDATVFGSGKNGLLITNNGLFAHNGWTGADRGGEISWDDFLDVNILINEADDHHVIFDGFFTFDASGSNLSREEIQGMLLEIQESL